MRKTLTVDEYLGEKLKDPIYSKNFLQVREVLRLAVQLAYLRQEAGISQRQLALNAGISEREIALLEREQYNAVTLNTVQRLADSLGYILGFTLTEK